MDFVDDLWAFAPTGTLYEKLMQEKYVALLNLGLSLVFMIGYFVCLGTPVIPEIVGICFRDAWASHSVYLGLVLAIDACFWLGNANREAIVGLYYLPHAILSVIGETTLFATKMVLTIPALILATLSCCCCGCSSGLLLGAAGYTLWKKLPTEETDAQTDLPPQATQTGKAAMFSKFPSWINPECMTGMWHIYQGTATHVGKARGPASTTSIVVVDEHDDGDAAAAKLALTSGANSNALQLIS